MTQRHLFGIAVRWLPLFALGVIVATVPTYLLTSKQAPVYEVSATMLPAQLRLAGDPSYSTVSMSRLVGLATSYAFTAKGHELLVSVRMQLGLTEGPEDLTKRIDATVDANTAVLTITARAGDPSAAVALANAVAHAIEAQSAVAPTDEALLQELDTIRRRMIEAEGEYARLLALPPPRTTENTAALADSLTLLRELKGLYDSLGGSTKITPSGLIVVDEADVHFAQMIAPRTMYYSLLAAVAGLIIAAAVASVLEYLDDRIKTPEDAREATGLTPLGAIRRKGWLAGGGDKVRLATLRSPRSPLADAFRSLRASIDLATHDDPIRTLLVTSNLPTEGKTITAANVAVAYAQAGKRVVLVDADLRRPAIHRLFRLPNDRGLSTLLRDSALSIDSVALAVEQSNLRVVTSGPSPLDPAADLGSERIQALIQKLAADCDLVVFDSPALPVAVDAAVLSSVAGGTLLVIDARRGRRSSAVAAAVSLANAHANVIGAVLFDAARGSFPDYRDQATPRREEGAPADHAAEPVSSA